MGRGNIRESSEEKASDFLFGFGHEECIVDI
jgi:hypothetical protein